jgi:RNA polymerase sigma-70 factor, ECF subfamily
MTTNPQISHLADTDLLEGVALQKSECLEQIYRRYAQAIYAFAFRRTSDAAIAHETVNDTFLQLWQGKASFAGQSTVKTWLLGIAKHKVLDILRARGKAWEREEELTEEEENQATSGVASAYALLLAKQQGEHLQACMDQLSPAQTACVHLHFVEGLTLAQIAQVLDIPANTAATRVHHARRKLRECMECVFGKGQVL